MCVFCIFRHVDVRLHQIVSTSSEVIRSPNRHQYAMSGNEQIQNSHTLQRHTDSRLPPDLLPYGQHQSLVLQSSLKNSSSSSTGSSTSTAILDHRNPAYNGNNNGSGNGSNRFAAFTYTDDRLSEHLDDDDDDDESDMQQLFVRHTPIEEPDLRIYHHDNVIKTTNKSYAKLNSPSPTISTNSIIGTNKTTMSANLHRTANSYELTPASTILNTCNYSVKHFNKTNASKAPTLQMNPVNKAMDNDSGKNCKPRQSVVRTSPSFSFLSTGYNQQQDNFL